MCCDCLNDYVVTPLKNHLGENGLDELVVTMLVSKL